MKVGRKIGLSKRSSASVLVSVMVDGDKVGNGQDLTLYGVRRSCSKVCGSVRESGAG